MAACGPSRGFCNVRSGSRNGLDSLAQLIVFNGREVVCGRA